MIMDNSDKALAELNAARDKAAVGGEFAPDYITVKGVRFHYKTVAHAWIIPAVFNRLAGISDFEKGVISCYLLSMSAEEVRNRAMQELSEGKLLDNALGFFIDNGISPEDFEQIDVERLMLHPYQKNG